MKDLSFRAPPSLAVAVGATTPNPGVVGSVVWSTTAGALLIWSGSQWVSLSGGDSTPARIDIYSYTFNGGF